MSKYEPLWQYVGAHRQDFLTMSFKEIMEISGIPLDHSFLTYKKELLEYGWQVKKVFMKNETVLFEKIK